MPTLQWRARDRDTTNLAVLVRPGLVSVTSLGRAPVPGAGHARHAGRRAGPRQSHERDRLVSAALPRVSRSSTRAATSPWSIQQSGTAWTRLGRTRRCAVRRPTTSRSASASRSRSARTSRRHRRRESRVRAVASDRGSRIGDVRVEWTLRTPSRGRVRDSMFGAPPMPARSPPIGTGATDAQAGCRIVTRDPQPDADLPVEHVSTATVVTAPTAARARPRRSPRVRRSLPRRAHRCRVEPARSSFELGCSRISQRHPPRHTRHAHDPHARRATSEIRKGLRGSRDAVEGREVASRAPTTLESGARHARPLSRADRADDATRDDGSVGDRRGHHRLRRRGCDRRPCELPARRHRAARARGRPAGADYSARDRARRHGRRARDPSRLDGRGPRGRDCTRVVAVGARQRRGHLGGPHPKFAAGVTMFSVERSSVD